MTSVGWERRRAMSDGTIPTGAANYAPIHVCLALKATIRSSCDSKASFAGRGSCTATNGLHSCTDLFDHPIGLASESRRYVKSKRLGGLEIDRQFESARLLDRQVAGLRTAQDAIYK
jgi:hypothetical protein